MLNILNYNLLICILLIFSNYYTNAGQIVDFQYAEYSQTAVSSSRDYDRISILPNALDSKTFQFPQACYNIQRKLSYSCYDQTYQLQDIDLNDYLQSLKEKFLQLMTISQQITISQSKIQHLNGLIHKTVPLAPSKIDIRQLQIFQIQLKKIAINVDQKTLQLQGIISQNTEQMGDSRRLQKEFMQEAIKDKLQYLRKLKQQVQKNITKNGEQANFSAYFDNLKKEYQIHSTVILSISTIMISNSRLAELKLNASNLEASIKALKLYIQDLAQCHTKQKNIRKEFKDHQKIRGFILQLSEIKKKQSGTNQYCEGVVKRLTIQIKNLLNVYEIFFSCGSDLDEKKQSLLQKQLQLNYTRSNITDLQSNTPNANFEKMHSEQMTIIDKVYEQMKSWKINDYVHSPVQIQSLIEKAQQELQKVKKELKDLSPAKPTKISTEIPNLIKQIKNFKFQYCKIYQKYDSLANKLWSQSYVFQSQSKLLKKLKQLYKQQWQRLSGYQKQFYILKKKIEKEI